MLAAWGGLALVLGAWWEILGVMIKARTPPSAERFVGYLACVVGFLAALIAGAAVAALVFLPIRTIIDDAPSIWAAGS